MAVADSVMTPSQSPDPQTEAIRVLDLHKSFGKLEVLKGETPSSGQIIVNGEAIAMRADGTPVNRRQIERIRTRLGMVFQAFNLWTHRTLLENVIEVPVHVLKTPRHEAIARAKVLLERVGLADKADTFPAFLSGGQQQRAAIARALAVDPAVMLFDVLTVIRDLAAEGRTMLLVTHEMKFAREVATHVIYLFEGRIEEQGPPAELFGNPKSPRLQQFLKTVGW